MLDMQVIEALYLKDEGPHDYLHIKHESASPSQVSARLPSSPMRRDAETPAVPDHSSH